MIFPSIAENEVDCGVLIQHVQFVFRNQIILSACARCAIREKNNSHQVSTAVAKGEKMKKFWTTQDGKIGTAHLHRDGKVVDFRPGEVGAEGWHTAAPKIKILPPKGQGAALQPILLEPSRIEKKAGKKEVPCPGMQEVILVLVGEYLGVEVRYESYLTCEWYDSALKAERDEELRRENEAFEQAKLGAAARREAFFQTLTLEQIIARVSPAEVARLRGGSMTILDLLKEKIVQMLIEAGADTCETYWHMNDRRVLRLIEAAGGTETVLEKLFAFEQARKEEKKRAWLARVNK